MRRLFFTAFLVAGCLSSAVPLELPPDAIAAGDVAAGADLARRVDQRSATLTDDLACAPVDGDDGYRCAVEVCSRFLPPVGPPMSLDGTCWRCTPGGQGPFCF